MNLKDSNLRWTGYHDPETGAQPHLILGLGQTCNLFSFTLYQVTQPLLWERSCKPLSILLLISFTIHVWHDIICTCSCSLSRVNKKEHWKWVITYYCHDIGQRIYEQQEGLLSYILLIGDAQICNVYPSWCSRCNSQNVSVCHDKCIHNIDKYVYDPQIKLFCPQKTKRLHKPSTCTLHLLAGNPSSFGCCLTWESSSNESIHHANVLSPCCCLCVHYQVMLFGWRCQMANASEKTPRVCKAPSPLRSKQCLSHWMTNVTYWPVIARNDSQTRHETGLLTVVSSYTLEIFIGSIDNYDPEELQQLPCCNSSQ